jgi:hypothetical protein
MDTQHSGNRLTISEYYQIVKHKLESNDYSLSESPKKVGYITSNARDINPHLEAINYLQWEFMSDRKDQRIDKVFSDICIPNNINQGDLDVDFSNYSVEEFLKEIMKLKN